MDTNVSDIYFKKEEQVLDVIDVNQIDLIFAFDEQINYGIDVLKMTSLKEYMLLEKLQKEESGNELVDDDNKLQRLSLAYERLHTIPKLLLQELAHNVKILDISHNEFDKLDFLSEFKQLTTLICDHNKIGSEALIPHTPKLELLWLNHCKISSLYPWARKLQSSCPNLRYLSLMGNPVAPSYVTSGNFYEYLQYRFFIISLFPKLVHLDDRPVSKDQRVEAEKMYKVPLMERIVNKTHANLPICFRNISEVVTDMLSTSPSFVSNEKNVIV